MDALIQAVAAELRRILCPRLSFRQVRTLAIEFVLVGLGIRTGYLVDVLSPVDAVATFSSSIRAVRHTFQGNLMHVYDAASDQSFLVNTALLRNRIDDVLALKSVLAFVSLDPLSASYDVPAGLVPILQELSKASREEQRVSYTLPDDTAFVDIVPLAAILLDYRIAYIPPSKAQPLTNLSLEFHQATVRWGNDMPAATATVSEQEHVFFRFSSPTDLRALVSVNHPAAPAKIIADLGDMFNARLRILDNPIRNDIRITIQHEHRVVDQMVF